MPTIWIKKKKNIFSSFVCANKIALANIAVLNIFYQSIRLFMILSHISLAYLFQKFNFQYHSPRELVSTQNFGNEFWSMNEKNTNKTWLLYVSLQHNKWCSYIMLNKPLLKCHSLFKRFVWIVELRKRVCSKYLSSIFNNFNNLYHTKKTIANSCQLISIIDDIIC